MEIDDLYKVWKLGESLFDEKRWPNLYRTWDCYSVTELFNTDSEFCLVAEEEDDGIIGFCMGTTIKKASWKYGYLEWLGVDTKYQRAGIARRLFDAFFKLVLEDGVRILLVDTQADNIAARRFFEKIGFTNEQPCVYLSKTLEQKPETQPEQPKENQPEKSEITQPSTSKTTLLDSLSSRENSEASWDEKMEVESKSTGEHEEKIPVIEKKKKKRKIKKKKNLQTL